MKRINLLLTVTPKRSCCRKSKEEKNKPVEEDAVVGKEKEYHFLF
jgi:hypothetical protein